jgi:hypothetical protein
MLIGGHLMDNENYREIYKVLNTSQDKYVYFILTASVAAIGFTITQTKTLSLSLTQIPLGLSLICWGLSFWFGCRNREYYNSTLYSNGELIKVQTGQNPRVGNDPRLIQAATEGMMKALNHNSDKINLYGSLQMRMFLTGAIFYIIWHVIEMYLRS